MSLDRDVSLNKLLVRRILPLSLRKALLIIGERVWRYRCDVGQWLYDCLPDNYVQSLQFKRKFGRRLNFDAPKTFNEKIHWLMRYDHRPILTQLADKYAVREYVSARVGAAFLNDLYGVWDDPMAIPFEELPDSFVLKVNWGSSTNIFCKDKAQLNIKSTRGKLAFWMRRSEYWTSREWAYKNIPPRILCERFLTDEQGQVPPDYKFFCFNGEPRFVHVQTGRFTNHRYEVFDLEWKPLPFSVAYPSSGSDVPRPGNLETMISVAQTLSQGFPFVRVDLYSIQERVIFGEMTLYPTGGLGRFIPDSYDLHWGHALTLPKPSSSSLVKPFDQE